MTTIQLKEKNQDGAVKKVPFDVEKMTIGQTAKVIKPIFEIIKEVQGREGLIELIKEQFSDKELNDKKAELNQYTLKELKEQAAELGYDDVKSAKKPDLVHGLAEQAVPPKEIDMDMINGIFGGLDVVLITAPDKLLEVLSIASGVERQNLEEQEQEVFFEIYEAVLEVNDLEQLIERGKKSFNLTKSKGKALGLLKKSGQVA